MIRAVDRLIIGTVFSDHTHCPADLNETAEAFVMNRLAPADSAEFLDHLLTCPRCADAVEDAERYVRGMKVAAQRLRAATVRTAAGF